MTMVLIGALAGSTIMVIVRDMLRIRRQVRRFRRDMEYVTQEGKAALAAMRNANRTERSR